MVGTSRDSIRSAVTIVAEWLSALPSTVALESRSGAYQAAWTAVKALPEPIAAEVFKRGADIATRRQGKGVRRLESNLRRVVGPEMSQARLGVLTRDGMRSYARYWRELFRPQTYDPARIMRDTDLEGWDFFRSLLKDGRPIIFSLSHSGNWEAAGVWLIGTGVPFTTVAERLEPESLFQQFVAFREGLGMEVLPLTGGEAPPFPVLADRLRSGRSVCLLGDRDLSRRGVEVEFFGATARMPGGPAALAIDTGAILFPPGLSFTRKGWGLHARTVIEVPADGTREEKIQQMTQDVARSFEGFIAENPQDWHMLQRVWLDDLDPRRVAEERARSAAEAAETAAATQARATETTQAGEAGEAREVTEETAELADEAATELGGH